MSDLIVQNLFEASFRGQPFYIDTSSTISGGQKLAVYDYVNSSRRDIFYMGDKPNEYTIKALLYPEASNAGQALTQASIITNSGATVTSQPNSSNTAVTPRTGDYFRVRNNFLNALKAPGKGKLVHPFYGEIECYVESWSATEDIKSLGFIEIDITFKVDVSPLQAQFGISTKNAIDEIIDTDLLPTLEATLVLPPKNQVYFSKLVNFIGVIQTVVGFVKNIDLVGFASLIVGRNLRPFLVAPTAIYNLLRNVFRTIGRQDTLPVDTRSFSTGIRDFNASLQPQLVNYNTESALEYNNNLLILKSVTEILLMDCLFAYAIDNGFETVVDLEYYRNIVDDIYNDFVENCPSESLVKIGEDIKQKFSIFLEEQTLTTLKVITVSIPGEPLDVLLYRYYENLDFRDQIIRLNNIKDTSWVSGDMRLITK